MGNDFATPALYFFSTVAQTMGAIIAIVLTGVFAIIPQIQQQKDKTGSEVLIRLLKKDDNLIQALWCGFSAIIISVTGLLALYLTGQSQSISIFVLVLLAISTVVLGICSTTNIVLFAVYGIPKYGSIENCYLTIVKKQVDFRDIERNADYLIVAVYYYSTNYPLVYNFINDINVKLNYKYYKNEQDNIYKVVVEKIFREVFSKKFDASIFKVLIAILNYQHRYIYYCEYMQFMKLICGKVRDEDQKIYLTYTIKYYPINCILQIPGICG